VLFGLPSALHATRTDPIVAMKSGGRGTGAGGGRSALRHALVVAQVALSLVLLITALLFSRSLGNLLTENVGFQAEGLVSASLAFARLAPSPERIPVLRRALVDRVRAIPGVESATETGSVPFTGSGGGNNVWLETAGSPAPQSVTINEVGAEYFKTLGTPVLDGRAFDDRDTLSSPKVVIVNEAFARAFPTPGRLVGLTLRREATPTEPETTSTIVGVTRDAKFWDVRDEFEPTVFMPRLQQDGPGPNARILLRTHLPMATVTAAVTRAVGEVNPEIGLQFQELTAEIKTSLLRDRLMAMLSGFFGVLAALLATIGLYGVLSYTVARRRNEFGIRTALGASRRHVIGMVLRETMGLVSIGLAIGSVLAFGAARAAGTLLFGLTPQDPTAIAAAITILVVAALAASYLPARRAAHADPTQALRGE
jgi:predicted permease